MIELKKVDLWKKSVDAISSFITTGNFRFSNDGIKFRAMDQSQIVLINYEMDKKVFDKYEIEPNFVGLDIVELSKVMNRTMQNDTLLMELSEADLTVKFNGDINRAFKLPLLDVLDEEVNLPKANFDAKIIINGKILREALKDASLFGSAVFLKVKGDKFLIESKGSGGNLKTVMKKTKKIEVNTKSDVVSKYSLNFLTNIVKDVDVDENVILELSSDAPMKVTYSIGTSKIEFYLAPMII